MGWKIIKQVEPITEVEKELLQETIVRTSEPTIKLWTKEQVELEVQKIDNSILELQERKTVLLEQTEKFEVIK